MARPREDIFQRLFDRLETDGPLPEIDPSLGPCWMWTGPTNEHGYPFIWYNKEYHKIHRFIFWLLVGNLIEGMQIDHRCNVKLCANPDHLEQVTPKVNTNRAIEDGLRRAGNPYSDFKIVPREERR